MCLFGGVRSGMDAREPSEEKTFTKLTKPSTATVRSNTLAGGPQVGSTSGSAGSTNNGKVTARAPNVHVRPAHGHQRGTFIHRATAISRGCKGKKAAPIREIPHLPVAI